MRTVDVDLIWWMFVQKYYQSLSVRVDYYGLLICDTKCCVSWKKYSSIVLYKWTIISHFVTLHKNLFISLLNCQFLVKMFPIRWNYVKFLNRRKSGLAIIDLLSHEHNTRTRARSDYLSPPIRKAYGYWRIAGSSAFQFLLDC